MLHAYKNKHSKSLCSEIFMLKTHPELVKRLSKWRHLPGASDNLTLVQYPEFIVKGGGTHNVLAVAFLHPLPQTITNILVLGCKNEPTFGFSLSPMYQEIQQILLSFCLNVHRKVKALKPSINTFKMFSPALNIKFVFSTKRKGVVTSADWRAGSSPLNSTLLHWVLKLIRTQSPKKKSSINQYLQIHFNYWRCSKDFRVWSICSWYSIKPKEEQDLVSRHY